MTPINKISVYTCALGDDDPNRISYWRWPANSKASINLSATFAILANLRGTQVVALVDGVVEQDARATEQVDCAGADKKREH